MADYEEEEEDFVRYCYPPVIDDLFIVNDEILRTCGVHVREQEDGSITLYINLSRTDLRIMEDIPQAFRDAFKEI